MKAAIVFACLLVAAAAKPQLGFGFGPYSGASGFGSSGSTQGLSSGLFGTSAIQHGFANAGVSTHMLLLSVNESFSEREGGYSQALIHQKQFRYNVAILDKPGITVYSFL